MRPSILAAILIFPFSASAQSSTDSQTLQALLSEMRQLRQELRTANINTQRAQILIYRVQSQQTVVNRLAQKADGERSRLTQTQAEEKRFASVVKRMEDSQSSKSEAERKQADEQIAEIKVRLEELVGQEQDLVTRKMQAEEELALEQSKLTQLQDALDRIDKDLEQASRSRN